MVDFSKFLTEEDKENIRKKKEFEESLPRSKIRALMIYESGTWNSKSNKYENIRFRKESKELEMVLRPNERGTIIKFEGGPTGYESFYIEDFLKDIDNFESDRCSICAGTINSYAQCIVSLKEVVDFIKSNMTKFNYEK